MKSFTLKNLIEQTAKNIAEYQFKYNKFVYSVDSDCYEYDGVTEQKFMENGGIQSVSDFIDSTLYNTIKIEATKKYDDLVADEYK